MAGIKAIEQNYPYLLGKLGGITTGGVSRKAQPIVEGQNPAWGAAAARVQSGELTPNVGDSGSSYTNGLGHSKHTLRLMA